MKIIAVYICLICALIGFVHTSVGSEAPTSLTFVEGVNPTLKSAFLLLAKKADNGDGVSQLRMGLHYYSGKSLVKDDAKAISYLEKALHNKTPQAKEALIVIHFNAGVLAQKKGDLEEAASHFAAAASLGDVESKERLAQVEDKLIPEFPPPGTGLKNAEGLFPDDIEPNPLSAVCEYVYACLDNPKEALAQPDFTQQKITLAYGDITVSKGNGLFSITSLDPVTAEAAYQSLLPHKKIRVALQDDGTNKTLLFAFKSSDEQSH